MINCTVKSILVVIDRSSHHTPAMDEALRFSKHFGATLSGVGLIDEYAIAAVEAMGLIENAVPPLVSKVKHQYKLVLEAYAKRCANEGVTCHLLEEGALPLARVLWEAQRHDLVFIDRLEVVVPGSEHTWGQTLSRAVKNSPRPIVVVPHGITSRAGNTVVVAYDGSLQAARSLYAAAASVLRADAAQVHVVTVAHDRGEAARAASHALDFLHLHEIEAHSHAIETSDAPAEVILHEIERQGASLVVMGAYGEPVVREFFLGSVTRSLLSRSPAPIFLFH